MLAGLCFGVSQRCGNECPSDVGIHKTPTSSTLCERVCACACFHGMQFSSPSRSPQGSPALFSLTLVAGGFGRSSRWGEMERPGAFPLKASWRLLHGNPPPRGMPSLHFRARDFVVSSSQACFPQGRAYLPARRERALGRGEGVSLRVPAACRQVRATGTASVPESLRGRVGRAAPRKGSSTGPQAVHASYTHPHVSLDDVHGTHAPGYVLRNRNESSVCLAFGAFHRGRKLRAL